MELQNLFWFDFNLPRKNSLLLFTNYYRSRATYQFSRPQQKLSSQISLQK